MNMKKLTFCLIGLITMSNVNAQLTVAVSTAAQLVDTLLGTGVTASGISFTGYPVSTGIFNGAFSNIGFTSGALLTTGDVDVAPGPNAAGGASLGGSAVVCTDPQLNAIATTTLYDAAILEFDFVPTSDTLKFRYVFASEEYPEFVCSNFNDVFGFFISGPNPAGGTYTSQNIAIIPGSGGLPVAINTVNPGVAGSFGAGGCTSLAYSSYYFDNSSPPGTTVEFDGFTVPLTAIANVVCGQTYHIKLAIADAGDGGWDSGVFLEAGSFSSQGVSIVPEISYGGPNDSTLFEGCGLACIYFVRTSNLASADTITVNISGSAVNGVDYNTGVAGVPLPSQLIYAAGQDSISYCVNAVSDGVLEGLDTIQLAIIQTGACSSTATYATVYLNEYTPLTLSVSDTTFCNSGGTFSINTNVSGGVEPYTYSWSGGLPSTANPSVAVTTTTSYTVTVNDACNASVDPTPAVTDIATATVATFAPMVVSAGNDQIICPGDATSLNASITGGGAPYTYTWLTVSGTDSVNSPNTAFTTLNPNTGGTYQIVITDICGNTQTDQASVLLESGCILNIPNVITPDGHGPTVNELFFVENLDKFPGSSLAIYNRWGNKLFESSDYKNDWNGSKSVDGVYYYVLTVPASGTTMATANVDSSSFRATKSDDEKVFAGYFQITRMK
jgi:hypothetical protein